MIDEPSVLRHERQHTAVIRLTIARAKIQEEMGPAIGEVMATVSAQGIAPTGAVFSHHFRMDPETFDFEVGVPVATPVAPAGRVTSSELPAVTVARTVYQGPYEGRGEAWGGFVAWIVAAGHEAETDLWECYVKGPESGPDPAVWRTELNRPLKRVAVKR